MKFDAALTGFNSRQFKIRMKKMAAHVDFGMFLNAFFLACNAVPEIGTFVLIKVLPTYLRFFDEIVLLRFKIGWQSGELYATSSGDSCMSELRPSLSHVASLDTR